MHAKNKQLQLFGLKTYKYSSCKIILKTLSFNSHFLVNLFLSSITITKFFHLILLEIYMNFSRPNKGFSLIELMIVVAIIGILSIIAVPSYQGYAKRARFAEVISATYPFKIAIALALQQGDTLADLSNNAHGIPTSPAPTKNLSSIIVESGTITATGTSLVDNSTYILKPNVDGSLWQIEGSCLITGWCES